MADADEEDERGDIQSPRDPIAHPGHDEAVAKLDEVGVRTPADDREQEGDERPVAQAGPPDGRERGLLQAPLPLAQRCHVTAPSARSIHGHTVDCRSGVKTSPPTASPWPGR